MPSIEQTQPVRVTPAPASTGRLPSALLPFRHRAFLTVWVATLLANMGIWVHQVGAAQAMLALSPSAELTALIQAALALPMLLFSLVAGAAADLWDRRTVVLLGQALMAVSAILFAGLDYAGLMTPWLLLALTVLLATGSTWRQPAYQASVNAFVPREEVAAAVALNSVGFNAARSIGPALGGLIVVSFGTASTFAFNAVASLAVIAAFVGWRREVPKSDLPRERLVPAMIGGLRYVRGAPLVLAVVARAFAFGLFASPLWALLPVVAARIPGGGPPTYGLLLGALGLGAVFGAGVLGALRRRLHNEGVVSVGHVMFTSATVALALIDDPTWLLPFLMIGGAAWTLVLASLNVVVQLAAADWVKGRALAVYYTGLFGGMTVGSWAFGRLAEATGLTEALLAAAVGVLAGAFFGLIRRLPNEIARDFVDPLPTPPVPTVAAGLDVREGLVAVVVQYEVRPADSARFARAMRGLRRIRRRDGAVRWTLYQDVAEPTIWLETFVLPSWLDELRHMRRATRGDRTVLDRVKAFHRGARPPSVRHLVARETPAPGWPPGRAGR